MSSSTKQPTLIRVPGSGTPSDTPQRSSGLSFPRTDAVAAVGTRYAFLATWSAVLKWKRATKRFTDSLAAVECYRSSSSFVRFDASGRMSGVRGRWLHDDD